MEYIRRCLLFIVTLLQFHWLNEPKHYVTCIPTKGRMNLQDFFGAENMPRPSILSRVGRDTSSAKKYMINLYKFTTGEVGKEKVDDGDEEFANQTVVEKADTVVSFVNNGLRVPRPNATDGEGAMFFDVESLLNFVIESTLKSDLRIYLNASSKSVRDSSLKVTIYQIIIPKVRFHLITSRVINASTSHWHDFDILEATQSWKEDQSKNKGILVTCQTLDNIARTMKECGLVDFKGDSENRPFLVSFYQSGDEEELLAEQLPQGEAAEKYAQQIVNNNNGRARRSLQSLFPHATDTFPPYTMTRNEHPSNTTCIKHKLFIRFKDLGWHQYIIAPDGYEAAYCHGECPFPLHDNMNASNHAIIQTLVHLIKPSDIPQPCCSPLNLQPLQVLFYNDNTNIVMKRYTNMVVDDCGCQ